MKSQPLDPKLFGDDFDKETIEKIIDNRQIKEQYMGRMFDIDDNYKDTIWNKICRFCRLKDRYYDIKWAIRNWCKWGKVIANLRPWSGDFGVLILAQHHLKDYLETEIKYGHSEESYKKEKIASVKECLEILKRLEEDDYDHNLLSIVYANYPKYSSMITKYEHSTMTSGNFVKFDCGWVGMESGKNPRRGYFEFVNGKFELIQHENQSEINLLLEELNNYHRDIRLAYAQGQENRENDMKRLGKILNESFWSWWD